MLLKHPIPLAWHEPVEMKYSAESGTILAVKPDLTISLVETQGS
jgi:hypothetical protein